MRLEKEMMAWGLSFVICCAFGVMCGDDRLLPGDLWTDLGIEGKEVSLVIVLSVVRCRPKL